MICPECEKETYGPDFCGHCAAPVREKCGECGKMELIGKKFCATKIRSVENLLKAHKISGIWKYEFNIIPILLFGLLALLVFIFSQIYADKHAEDAFAQTLAPVSVLLIIVIMMPGAFLSEQIEKTRRKKLLDSFLSSNPNHPEYKQVLEREEKGEGK